jgi:dihydrodipicolinate synthase/N-acetylneuraminate lyase
MLKIHDLAGVIPALASPLTRDGGVDEAGVGRLVEHVIAGGVTGLLALGSTGECSSLDEASRRGLLAAVAGANAGRVPIICGVAQTSMAGAQLEVAAAAALGADAALVTPPFYYPTDQAGVLAFYRSIARKSPIPIFLYNIPQFTKVVAATETVAVLAREGTIAGIKDSSRDFEYFELVRAATRDLPHFRVFTGSDSMLLASLVMGGSGTICGAANVAPAWVVQVYDAFRAGDLESARQLQERLTALVMRLRGGVFPGAIKAALDLQGICGPWLAKPHAPLGEADRAELEAKLAEWGLLARSSQAAVS